MEQQKKYPDIVLTWLKIGLVMVFVQVIVGGITRLTESGLSITKWEIVSGTLPPVSEEQWLREFELYKKTPQYREVNEGMTFSDFKFIYFWEFIHRFWARIMGFAFIIPFIYFYIKRYLDRKILKHLSLVILLAVLAATFGWVMVASGLIERPWVNAYKLALHLLIAFSVFSALFWTYLNARYKTEINTLSSGAGEFNKFLIFVTSIFIFQLFLGGILSGMKAAVVYPTWPYMHGEYFPAVIFDINEWNSNNFNNYDKNFFMPALIHFLHRNTAYLLFIFGCILSYKLYKFGSTGNFMQVKRASILLISTLIFQIILGIITVISSVGSIPVLWGVLHQAGALILLSSFVYIIFILRIKKIKK